MRIASQRKWLKLQHEKAAAEEAARLEAARGAENAGVGGDKGAGGGGTSHPPLSSPPSPDSSPPPSTATSPQQIIRSALARIGAQVSGEADPAKLARTISLLDAYQRGHAPVESRPCQSYRGVDVYRRLAGGEAWEDVCGGAPPADLVAALEGAVGQWVAEHGEQGRAPG